MKAINQGNLPTAVTPEVEMITSILQRLEQFGGSINGHDDGYEEGVGARKIDEDDDDEDEVKVDIVMNFNN